MFSKEMESLIEATLQDGILTDQEKAVLVKRAQKEGIDVDELEIYIQSLLQKRHQGDANNNQQSGIGTLQKCPTCGYKVQIDKTVCPACGTVLSTTTPPPAPIPPKVENQPVGPASSTAPQAGNQQQTNNTIFAKKPIPDELDALIQEYLTDGILTDKERQVILDEAETLGLNRAKIDLYLDAQVQKIDQATDAAVRRQKGKQCPHCGAYVSQMTDKCPECEQYITPEATKELEEILDNLEEALVNMKSRKEVERSKATVERYARKARMYYSNHPKIKALLAEVDNEMHDAENKIKSAERKEAVTSLLKNKWFWCTVPIIIGALLLFWGLFGIEDRVTKENIEGIGGVSMGLGVLAIIYIAFFSMVKSLLNNKLK